MTDLPPVNELPPVRHLLRDAPDAQPYDQVSLTYDQRIVRRKRLTTLRGESFFIDLEQTTSLDHYYGFELEDGRIIQLTLAPEELLEISGDLPRLAYHIGNRHTPCQIKPDRILIRHDHVLDAMLQQLGASVTHVTGPFLAEGGAYGHGRTMGHNHSHDHSHDHGPKPEPEDFSDREGPF